MRRRRGMGGGMYERGWGHHGDAWYWLPRLGFLLVMAGLLALAVVLLVRAVRQRPAAVVAGAPMGAAPGPAVVAAAVPVAADDAVAQALRLRYARGDIGRDEYLRTAADLAIVVPTEAPADRTSSPDPTSRIDGV